MEEKWPAFKTHEDAKCSNCGSQMLSATYDRRESGYPNGRHMAHCDKCVMWTFYDVDVD